MSTLRQCLRHPGTYLGLLALAGAVATADSLRPPGNQFSARVYVALVHSYQDLGSPVLAGHVRCRFRPTCSHYSIEAVRRYGLRKGLVLTAARLWRCRGSVPLETSDPVS